MGITGNIIQTTPATVKAFIVSCDQDQPGGTLSYHSEPVIAWIHEINSNLFQTGDSQCYPVTALHGVVLEDYALFFPDDGNWQVHSYGRDGEEILISEGWERLEKYLAEQFEKRRLSAGKKQESDLGGFVL